MRQGGEIFQKLTGENIGKQLAIVLDDRVYSAPVIRSRIGSHGQIEGRFSSAEAADLAVVLRSGSLSLPVAIEEERMVGPGPRRGFDRSRDPRDRRRASSLVLGLHARATTASRASTRASRWC